MGLMTGILNLGDLLNSMKPLLQEGEFAFVTVPGRSYGAHAELCPIASISEEEGLTLVVPHEHARMAELNFDGVFRMITLNVHSSLAAVGFTAAVADVLARQGISANVLAAFYHDHVFVPADRADEALSALESLRRG